MHLLRLPLFRLLAINLGFNGGLRFFGRSRVAELEQAAESTRDGAPLFAVVAADAADGSDRDTVLCPSARFQREAQHGPQDFRVARFTPEDAANFGIDIGGHKCGDGRVVAGQAQSEIVLQLLPGIEGGALDVLPIGEDVQKAVAAVAEFDQATRFRGGQARLKKRGRIADLRNERLRTDPPGPGVAERFDARRRQTTSIR